MLLNYVDKPIPLEKFYNILILTKEETRIRYISNFTGEGRIDFSEKKKYVNTLRHIPGHPDYNPNFRQLIHVGYKVASEMGKDYTGLLEKYADIVGSCVEENIYERHFKRLFGI